VRPLRIGSRGSILARWQAEFVRKQLFQVSGVEAEIIIIKTSGDKMQQAALTQIGGKGIFIKELEEALLEETVDLAVHSVKDIPTETPGRLFFPAVCRRDDVRDCLVSHKGATLANLKQGARVGTSSLRRQAQLRHHRSDLDIRELRGNVTRASVKSKAASTMPSFSPRRVSIASVGARKSRKPFLLKFPCPQWGRAPSPSSPA